MDTDHLLTLVTVAESGSFSEAADRLHVTQPAISKRMALLEEQVGTKLYDRVGRHISLTEAGQVLLSKAKLILHEVAAAKRAIEDLKGNVQGKLSLATSHHVGLHYLPPYLREYTKRYPNVKLDLHFLDSEQAYHEVHQGKFDLAIITLAPKQDSRVASHTLWHDQLRFVCAPSHPLAASPTLQLADLSRHEAIMPDTSTHTTQLISRLFEQENTPLVIGTISNHLDTIKMLLSLDLGWGVLPERIIDSALHVLPLTHLPITRPLGCIHHSQRTLNIAAEKFLGLLHQDALSFCTPTK